MLVFCGNIVDILHQVKLRPHPLVDSTTVRFKAVVLLLLIHCSLLLSLFVAFCSVLVLFVQYLVSFFWLLYYNCLLGVMRLLGFCDTSTRCRGLVCSFDCGISGADPGFLERGFICIKV